jgi:sulfhydrogenase subunit beta (sulfur reductase)
LAFGSAPADPYYFRRREGILLFGYHQKQCGDQWCFCQSVDMEVSFDLMFYRRYDHYLVETGSDIGKGIIAEFRQFFDESSYVMTADDRRIENQLKLTDKEIAGLYANHGWEKLADRCVSCGVCNALCPTCYCFEFRDRTTADGTHKRVREHSECQLACFTSVAGGHTFRLEKTDRFKHRIYHQLQYFREKFRKTLCVGCGRCIRHCPTRIDFVTGINEMKEQQA